MDKKSKLRSNFHNKSLSLFGVWWYKESPTRKSNYTRISALFLHTLALKIFIICPFSWLFIKDLIVTQSQTGEQYMKIQAFRPCLCLPLSIYTINMNISANAKLSIHSQTSFIPRTVSQNVTTNFLRSYKKAYSGLYLIDKISWL